MSLTNQPQSRREFFKTAGMLGVSSLLLAPRLRAGPPAAPAEPAAVVPTKIPRRKFGKTGVPVSMLALGGMFDIPNNQLILKQALAWGVTYWDTADCYGGGASEVGIGQYFTKNPADRAQVFLVTKSDARDPAGMTNLLSRSLARMKTDHIDLYFLHGVGNPAELKPEVKDWAEKAKKAGKIKFFGFSTHSNMEACLLEAAKLGWIDGIMLKYDFRLRTAERMKAAIAACAQAGLGLTAMKTQGGGPVRVDSEAELELAGRFLQKGFTDKQARLKAVWEDEPIAAICSQMPNLTILMSNIAAALNQTKLSAADHELLQRYARETGGGYCAGCAATCLAAVGGQAPVGDVMRCLMYYHQYGDRDLAREKFAQLPAAARQRLPGLDYTTAEQRCPQGLPIARLMKEAAELLAEPIL